MTSISQRQGMIKIHECAAVLCVNLWLCKRGHARISLSRKLPFKNCTIIIASHTMEKSEMADGAKRPSVRVKLNLHPPLAILSVSHEE
jgi:hypothetical protein